MEPTALKFAQVKGFSYFTLYWWEQFISEAFKYAIFEVANEDCATKIHDLTWAL